MTTTLYLVRHGAPEGSESLRFIGHTDMPLSPHGEAQVRALAQRLRAKPLSALYSSDLMRTRRSAEIIGVPHGLAPIALPGLREFAMGQWEGLTAEEIRSRDPAAFEEWMQGIADFQFPDGENLGQVTARAWTALEGILAAHEGGALAVVAHGGTNRALLCRALGVRMDRILAFGQDYAALTVLDVTAGRWTLRLLNHCEPVLGPSDPD